MGSSGGDDDGGGDLVVGVEVEELDAGGGAAGDTQLNGSSDPTSLACDVI